MSYNYHKSQQLSQITKDIPYAKVYFSDLRTPSPNFAHQIVYSRKKIRWRWGQCIDLGASRSTNPILVSSLGHCLDGKISPSPSTGGGGNTGKERQVVVVVSWGERKCWRESSWSNPMLFRMKFPVVDVFLRTKLLLLEMICFIFGRNQWTGPKMLKHRRPPHSYWHKVHRVHEVKGHIGHIHGWIVISCHLPLQCPGTTRAEYCPLDP